ncbi:hypothetical protein EDD15DRAFT_2201927 [Pisolithus albus]|nr:hypothetical protein EDD15DRAFT_2201927 [Pisolithus albus]
MYHYPKITPMALISCLQLQSKMATSSDCVSGQKNTTEEELIEKWLGTLNEIDTCILSAPMEQKSNEVLEGWLHQWKMLSVDLTADTEQANMTELFEEYCRVGLSVPALSPGDQANYNRGKDLQVQFEQVISSRKRDGCVDGSKTRQVRMSTESVLASVEATPKGNAAPIQEDRVPKTRDHTNTADVSRGKPHTEVEFHKQIENSREGCQQCMSEMVPCTGVEGKSCPRCSSKRRSCSFSRRVVRKRSTKKRSGSLQPLDATPSDLAPRDAKRLRVKPPTQSDPSEGPSAIQENTPSQKEHGSGNVVVENSASPATPVLESSEPLPALLPIPATSSAARVARAEARIREIYAELLNLQRATTNLFSQLAELMEDLRKIRDGREV